MSRNTRMSGCGSRIVLENGYGLKHSGRGWAVGEIKSRNIGGVVFDTLYRPAWCAEVDHAVHRFTRGCDAFSDPLFSAIWWSAQHAILHRHAYEVRRLRALAGVSQEYLALFSRVDRRTLQRIERGQANPHASTLARLVDSLELLTLRV